MRSTVSSSRSARWSEGGHVDDGDVEGLEVGASGAGDAGDAGAHDMAGVLGSEQQDRSGFISLEAAQAGDGDGNGEVERQEGLAAFGLADADGLPGPEPVDQLLARAVFEVGWEPCREALHRRAPLDGFAPDLQEELFVEDFAILRRRRAGCMMASALGLPLAWVTRVSLRLGVMRPGLPALQMAAGPVRQARCVRCGGAGGRAMR